MTKYTLTKPLKNQFKIQVNPEQSEALQLELFKMGKKWPDGSQKIQLTDEPYLSIYADNDVCYNFNKMFYKNDKKPEIQFSDYFTENKEEMTPHQLIKEAKEHVAKANELIKEAEQVINRPKDADLLKRVEELEKNVKRGKAIEAAEILSKMITVTYEAVKNIQSLNNVNKNPEQVILPKHVKDIMFPEFVGESQNKEHDKYLDLTKMYTPDFLWIRGGGEFKDKAFFLDFSYNWQIVKDSYGVLVLIPTKK